MALAVSNQAELIQLSGNIRIGTATVTLDTAYPAGGSPGLGAALGLKSVGAIDVVVSTGYIVDYLAATDKLQVFNPGGGGAGTKATEAAGNLSASQIQVLYFGKGSAGG